MRTICNCAGGCHHSGSGAVKKNPGHACFDLLPGQPVTSRSDSQAPNQGLQLRSLKLGSAARTRILKNISKVLWYYCFLKQFLDLTSTAEFVHSALAKSGITASIFRRSLETTRVKLRARICARASEHDSPRQCVHASGRRRRISCRWSRLWRRRK